MFTIDGIRWDYPCQIERAAEIKASEISGFMLDKSYFNDVMGTYMSYTVTLAIPPKQMTQYSAVYELLTDPVDAHSFVLPYGNSTITITGRVVSVKDNYVRLAGGAVAWKGTTFTVAANHPTKEVSLDEVITRGAAPLPEGAAVSIGSVWAYGSGGWETVPSADGYTW